MNESFIPVRRLSQQSSPSEANNSTIYHIQQTLLIILEDIIISLKSIAPPNVCFLIVKLGNLLCVINEFDYLITILGISLYEVLPLLTGND